MIMMDVRALAMRYAALEPPVTLVAGRPSTADWTSLDRLVAAEVAVRVEAIAATRSAPPAVGGSLLMGWTARAVALPLLGALVLTDQAPVLDPATVWLQGAFDGHTGAVAWPEQVMAAPDDPVRATAETLRSLVGPLVEAVHACVPLGRRGLWAAVGDAVAQAASSLGRGEQDGPWIAAADAVCAALDPSSPGPRWVAVGDGDRTWTWFTRTSCCLAYQSPAHGYCGTCPKLAPDERHERLVTTLRNLHEGARSRSGRTGEPVWVTG